MLAPGRTYVLGRIAVVVTALPEPGASAWWPVGRAREGRKAMVDTSLYGPDGAPLAAARATWMAVLPGP